MRRWSIVPVMASLLVLASCGGNSGSSTSSPAAQSGPVTLQSIAITPGSAQIAQGTTQAFTATGNYSDGSTKDLTATAQWSCLLPMATESNNAPTQGLATAISAGTVLISASSGTVSNSTQLNITGATVSSLAVTPVTTTIGFGNQQQFTATATFSDMSTQDVTSLTNWTLSPAGPFISAFSGLAIGNSVGTFDVSASFGGQSTAFLTTPHALTVDLSSLVSVSIVPGNASIADSTQIAFSAIGAFNDGSTRDVSGLATDWTSSNGAVAANYGSTPGVFKGDSAGPTTVTASVGTFTPSTMLTVTDATLQSIAVTPATASLAAGTKVSYDAVGKFSDGSTQDLSSQLTWSTVGGTGAATVDSKGIVTGSAAGSVTVNATSSSKLGSIAGSALATVTAATLQSITVTPSTGFITPGGNLAFAAVGAFSDGSTQDVSTLAAWTSSNSKVAGSTTEVATISSNVATGQGVGQTTITAKWMGISGTADLMVVSPTQVSLAVTPTTIQFAAGSSAQLQATGTFVDGSTQDFTTMVNWSSSNAADATVGYQSGVVSGLAAGTSTITATLGSVTSTAAVTVQ